MNIQHTVQIRHSPADLWPWLTEPAHIQGWNPSIISDEPITPGPHGVGTRTKMKMREGSAVVEYETELTVYEPHDAVALEMRGGSLGAGPMQIRYDLSPSGDGTELHYQAIWQPRGWKLRLMAPLIGIVARRQSQRALERLQEQAEGVTSAA